MTGVVKRDMVRDSGPAMVGVCPPAGAAVRQARARIMERTDVAVVIEVICECGKKIILNCDCRPQASPAV